MSRQNCIWLSAVAVVLGLPAFAHAAAFTAGDVVVEEIGSGAAALTSGSTAVFLDEYTPTGTFVQSIPLPTAVSGANQPLTDSGTGTSDGMINLSTNGQYLTVTGYDAAPGVTKIVSSTVDRVVGTVNAAGAVDTSTHAAIFSGNNIRGAATTDGTNFYVAGAGTGTDSGVYLLPHGATSISSATNINSTIGADDVNIYGNTLYATTGTGTNTNVVQLGTSGILPTTSSALTELPNIPSGNSPHQFVVFNEGGNQVAYVSDDTGNALSKYELVASVWTLEGKVGAGSNDYTGLTGSYDPISGSVTLFATELNGDATSGKAAVLVSLVDTSGAGGTLTGTPTLLATAGTNMTFAGVAFAPVVATPEPASVVMAVMGLCALVGYGWRRRQAA